MRALIVEDDEVVQGVLKAYLTHHAEEHGKVLEVQQLLDASKALELLIEQQDGFDVVFLDVHLPQLGGDEIYSQLMKVKPQILGRIIFVTGNRDKLEARFPALDLNILDKPFRYRQLLEAMAAVS